MQNSLVSEVTMMAVLIHILRSKVMLSGYLRRQQARPAAEQKRTKATRAEKTPGYGSRDILQRRYYDLGLWMRLLDMCAYPSKQYVLAFLASGC